MRLMIVAATLLMSSRNEGIGAADARPGVHSIVKSAGVAVSAADAIC
jgi:hypothetical protein